VAGSPILLAATEPTISPGWAIASLKVSLMFVIS